MSMSKQVVLTNMLSHVFGLIDLIKFNHHYTESGVARQFAHAIHDYKATPQPFISLECLEQMRNGKEPTHDHVFTRQLYSKERIVRLIASDEKLQKKEYWMTPEGQKHLEKLLDNGSVTILISASQNTRLSRIQNASNLDDWDFGYEQVGIDLFLINEDIEQNKRWKSTLKNDKENKRLIKVPLSVVKDHITRVICN